MIPLHLSCFVRLNQMQMSVEFDETEHGTGALFDSGILGMSFHMVDGQIADDSTWREHILANHRIPYENKGWGRRYKVRILGLHDQGE